MFRRVLGLAMFMSALACLAAGCNGYSAEKAKLACDQERTAGACVTDEAYDQCITCYEECGAGCAAQGECPEVFTCE